MNSEIPKQNVLRRWLVRGVGLAVALLLGVIALHGVAVEAERQQFGTLLRVRGAVQYQAAGTTTWVQATERMRVNVGDKINTGPDGSAVIKLSTDNFVAININSQLTLARSTTRSTQDPAHPVLGMFAARTQVQDIQVDLARGRATSVLHGLRSNSQYQVKTPVATAGVRGTIFTSEVISPDRGVKQGNGNPAAGTIVNFSCIEGQVSITFVSHVTGELATFTLNPGQTFALVMQGQLSADGNSEAISPELENWIRDESEDAVRSEDPPPNDDQAVQENLTHSSSDNHYY